MSTSASAIPGTPRPAATLVPSSRDSSATTGNAIASSIRTYANNNRYPWAPSQDRTPVIEAPTGITFVDYENPPGVNSPQERIESFLASDRAAWYNHVNITAHPHGGHFIPWEIPEQWTTDLVRTFRSLRSPR